MLSHTWIVLNLTRHTICTDRIGIRFYEYGNFDVQDAVSFNTKQTLFQNNIGFVEIVWFEFNIQP